MSAKSLAKSLGLLSHPLYQKQHYPEKRDQIFQYFIVLDFEATCWEDKKTQPNKSEIIEFPAVLLNSCSGKIEETFHQYVMPTEHTVLSEFCKNLTGISQETVNSGIPLGTVMKLFSDWLTQICESRDMIINPPVSVPGKSHATFVTWSDWDLGTQLLYECKRKSLIRHPYFNSWIDLRRAYQRYYASKPHGLNASLQERGMLFVGREHSGINDARNTARLVMKMVTDGCMFRVTKTLEPGKSVLSWREDGVRNPVRNPMSHW